jgi:cation diffusion facilitator CzcD-associated flavoprotein CzcO
MPGPEPSERPEPNERRPPAKLSSAEVAIVGSGLAGFIAYATLCHGGLEPDEIAVFGLDRDPAAAWRRRAASIRQRRMRSESDGHCYPTSFPGLAVREALRRRDPRPLVLTVVDRYNPAVDEFLDHVEELRERTGWDASFRCATVERVRASDGGFQLEGLGKFRHVLVAPGHPGLAVPPELESDPRVVHAYEPHAYADRVAVVGAGMAAATEWLNALEAGASVVSVRRREPARRPLNLPRPLFSRRGLAAFHALPARERAARLRSWLAPSYPPGRAWDEPLERAARAGRFRVAAEVDGAEQVICATGFRRGFGHDPLLARLVAEHGLETVDGWIVLAPDSTVSALTDATRTLSLAGVPGQWAFPAADTLMGAKYAARRFLAKVRAWRTR